MTEILAEYSRVGKPFYGIFFALIDSKDLFLRAECESFIYIARY
jgi:hypothetical protein